MKAGPKINKPKINIIGTGKGADDARWIFEASHQLDNVLNSSIDSDEELKTELIGLITTDVQSMADRKFHDNDISKELIKIAIKNFDIFWDKFLEDKNNNDKKFRRFFLENFVFKFGYELDYDWNFNEAYHESYNKAKKKYGYGKSQFNYAKVFDSIFNKIYGDIKEKFEEEKDRVNEVKSIDIGVN